MFIFLSKTSFILISIHTGTIDNIYIVPWFQWIYLSFYISETNKNFLFFAVERWSLNILLLLKDQCFSCTLLNGKEQHIINSCPCHHYNCHTHISNTHKNGIKFHNRGHVQRNMFFPLVIYSKRRRKTKYLPIKLAPYFIIQWT